MSAPLAFSLKSRVVRWLVALQALLLTALVLLVVGALWATGHLLHEHDDDGVIDVLQEAIVRDANGQLALRVSPTLAALRNEIPDLWYAIRDENGGLLTGGVVPDDYAGIGDSLRHISQARLGWQIGDQPKPAARLKRVKTAAGSVQILAPAQGQMSFTKALRAFGFIFLAIALPCLAVMALATWFATPIVVRRALKSLDEAAAEAQQIDIDQRGTRLPTAALPAEIKPLIQAVNDALGRLDDGYERHKRFLIDAAHELRTPIAILNTRLESLPRSSDNVRLLSDVARLSTLAEQLLDLQRLNQRFTPLARVDLAALSQRVASDLAPLAIAAGYEMSFEGSGVQVDVMGDQTALERAVTNLVQNAIDHGGRDGCITIRVERLGQCGVIEVCDEGTGIPTAQRDHIFEPFYRLRPFERGAGLGLNLVREILQRHEGHVSVLDGPRGGACFRITLPALPASQQKAPASAAH
jgi:signal transduction histidine kinase